MTETEDRFEARSSSGIGSHAESFPTPAATADAGVDISGQALTACVGAMPEQMDVVGKARGHAGGSPSLHDEVRERMAAPITGLDEAEESA